LSAPADFSLKTEGLKGEGPKAIGPEPRYVENQPRAMPPRQSKTGCRLEHLVPKATMQLNGHFRAQ
jgi:hypothetical protein